jgi:replication-associated recombination protein RarA
MSSDHSQDPWIKVRTRHDLPADEVISALQKEIRRGHTENAALLAYEMLTTSLEMEIRLWQRLLAISVEDIGMGDTQAPILIHTLYQMRQIPGVSDGERRLFAIHAVRYLCTATKDRSSDEMVSWLKQEVESGRLPEIPDYALDMHTARGQRMGRGRRHFYEEGAQVHPELADRDVTYRQRMMEMLE